jgi:RimJ/RimL family protein N-acetyltransferase
VTPEPGSPSGHALPDRIVTRRLVLRCYRVSDAPALKRAIDANLEHLRPWMPWALEEPSPLDAIEARLAQFAASFAAGTNWVYGMFEPDEARVIGGAGLHPRIGDGGLEIGYWVDAGWTGRGLATEAAEALTGAAFGRPDIARVEIRCDPRNVASAGVPRRLGYRLVEILQGNAVTPTGAPRDTMVWRMARDEWAAGTGRAVRSAPSIPGTQGPAPSS